MSSALFDVLMLLVYQKKKELSISSYKPTRISVYKV
jgi:hypothetical protein